jgi:hypothetical protein
MARKTKTTMIDPKSSFEKIYGRKENSEFSDWWQKDFDLYFRGWKDGYAYAIESKELEKDMRALADLQRGVG